MNAFSFQGMYANKNTIKPKTNNNVSAHVLWFLPCASGTIPVSSSLTTITSSSLTAALTFLLLDLDQSLVHQEKY